MTDRELKTAAFALREIADVLDASRGARSASAQATNTVTAPDGSTVDISFGDIGPAALGWVPIDEQLSKVPPEVIQKVDAIGAAIDEAIARDTLVSRTFDRGTLLLGAIRQLLPLVLV